MGSYCNFVKIFLPQLGSDFLLINTDCSRIVFNKYLTQKIEEFGLELENDDPAILLCDSKGAPFDLLEHKEWCRKSDVTLGSTCRDLYVYEIKQGNRDRPVQDVKIYTPVDVDNRTYNELHKTLLQTLIRAHSHKISHGAKSGSNSERRSNERRQMSGNDKKSGTGGSANQNSAKKKQISNSLTVQE
ncbi:uncharacterized protein LOC142354298 [Convolutriloba macropyga]|uniref:uncharacterized protein LOC142354298 n=1 Tax=Convolutriloba macropyga TaxID=536237 RepID=UPI003F524E2F